MESKFYKNGELQDKKIVKALKKAAEDYENGEIAEVQELLLEISAVIYKWEATEYGVAPYCPLCGTRLKREVSE